MNPLGLFPQPEYADVASVGLPRALLYYRYAALWQTFFAEIGRTTVVSRPTDRDILTRGDALSIDECCLASKAYLGHVDDLIGRCDALFVPSLANVGGDVLLHEIPGTARPGSEHVSRPRRAHCVLPGGRGGRKERHAGRVSEPGGPLRRGCARRKACVQGSLARADARRPRRRARAGTAAGFACAVARPKCRTPLAILLVAHPYVAHDPCFGGQIAELLDGMGCVVAFADECDHDEALRASFDFSKRCLGWSTASSSAPSPCCTTASTASCWRARFLADPTP